MAGHQLAHGPGRRRRASCTASRRPSRPSACPRSGSPDAGRAEAEALGYTVVDAESVVVTHLTETIRATPPSCSPARRRARCSTSSRRPTPRSSTRSCPTCCRSARSSACCRRCCARASRSATSARSSRRSATRPALTRDPAMLAEYARQALGRTIVAPLPRRRGHAARDRARPGARAGGRRGDRADRRRRVPGDGPDPRAGARAGARRARSSRRIGARRAARCCCARRACAATCGGCASSACRSWRSAPTTRSRPGVGVETIGVVLHDARSETRK